MTPSWVAVAFAAIAALLDLAAPAGPAPSGVRRLLRAAPAGALAVALRLAGAPPLPAVALFAVAVADALALDGREPGVGGWTMALLAQLLLAAALFELASPGLLLRQPWRGAEAAVVLAGGLALLVRGRRPRGELAALAPVGIVLLTAAALGAGAQPLPALALPWTAAVALWAATAGAAWWRTASAGLGRAERALRSAAALALAVPLLPPPS